jgi:ribosomal RNA assembly protein
MSEDPKVIEQPEEEVKRKKDKYRKEKPWDNDPTIDKFKVEEFPETANPNGGPIEESSFAVLFP